MNVEMIQGVTVVCQTVKTIGNMQMDIYFYMIDNTLIDSGPSRLEKPSLELITNAAVDRVLYTHHHEDHTGNGAALEKLGYEQWIHPLGQNICANEADIPWYREQFWGKRPPFQTKPLKETFDTGKRTLQVLYTPGHSFDHVALYDASEGILFTGDLFVQPRPKSLFEFEIVPEHIQSLQYLLEQDFETTFCHHQGYLKDGRQALEKKLNYWLELTERVQEEANRGYTIDEITKKLFPKQHPMNIVSEGQNSPKHIVRSILTGKGVTLY